MRLLVPFLFLAACSGDTSDEHTDTSACTELADGTWSASGTCFGMAMSATLTSNGCSFAFSDWNMAMSVPEGGTVDGTDITFSGTGWDDCVGTTTDGTSIEGSCAGSGCTFEMSTGG